MTSPDRHAVNGEPRGTQVTVIGSWHWPYSRKDVALFGERGAVVTTNDRNYSLRTGRTPAVERQAKAERRVPPKLVRRHGPGGGAGRSSAPGQAGRLEDGGQ